MTAAQCPHHPHHLGARVGNCVACDTEAQTADAATGIANVRAELAHADRLPTERPEPNPTRDRALARARAERNRR